MATTSTTPKTKIISPDAVQIIHDEITDVRSKLADQAEQTQRIQRIFRVDEQEMLVGKLQSEQALLRAVKSLTEVVGSQMVRNMSAQERCDAEGTALYEANRESRQSEVRRSIAQIKYLSTLRQETTFVCPCGQHTGIMFVDEKGNIIVENMCPKDWWIKQARLAHEEHRLSQFNNEVEYAAYISGYKIG